MKTREQIQQIALERYPKDKDFVKDNYQQLKRDGFLEGFLLCQEQEHPNRCGHCSPDGTLRMGDAEIICPYCNGSAEEHAPKPKQ